MQPLILKYKTAYQQEEGSATKKIKSILMHHAHSWVWAGTPSMVADLIDDTHISANDIVDFLAQTYEDEGGNDEFHYAVRALQICLRKAELKNTHLAQEEYLDYEETDKEDGLDNNFHLYLDKNHSTFHGSI